MFAIVPIVVVVVPIAFGAPAMLVFIPPTMIATPAIFTSLVQFMASVFRLTALAAMMLDGFMKTMVGLGDAPLAVIVIGAQTRGAGKEQESGQRGASQSNLARSKNSRSECSLHSVLSSPLSCSNEA
jgi:hypothetical protein